MQDIQFRKKREIGDILSDSFTFLKQEIKPLTKLFAVYVLPFIVIYAILQVYVQKDLMGKIDLNDPDMILSNIKPIFVNILFTSLFGLFVQSLLAGTYFTYIDFYIKKGKGNFEIHEISGALFTNSLLALGISLLFFIIVLSGIMLFILPGIFMANTLSLALFIVIFENKGIGFSFSRSWSLVSTQWWNTLLINLLGLLIIWVTSLFFSIPAMIAGFTSTFASMQQGGAIEYPFWYWLMMGISTSISTLTIVILFTFIALQYFNLNERTKPIQPPVQNSLDE
jgi:hypothetical protein